jgi:adenine-specific DNA glycosylase
MGAKTCCRSSPRCADCPVVMAAVARRRRREHEDLVASLVDEIFTGTARRALPDPVARTLDALEQTRRGGRLPVGAA